MTHDNCNSILFDLILFQSPKELSRLFCYYKATDDPFYFVKTELANFQPRIFLFHDIISDDEIGFLRNISEKEVSTCTDQNMSEQIFSYCMQVILHVAHRHIKLLHILQDLLR